MTSKEALEELRFQVGNITYFTKDLQTTTFKVRDSGLFEIIAKDLEVLELIKNKKVDVLRVRRTKDCAIYNCYYIDATELRLTEEQFNTLKEWLER